MVKYFLLICIGAFVLWAVYPREHVATSAVVEPIYQGNENVKAIALTCNVFWGEDYIGQMLDILNEKNVQATFFIGGTWAEKYPDLVNKIFEQGHEIGSHGYSHPHPDSLSRQENLQDISRAEKIIADLIGEKPRLYAPPYGERGSAVLEAAQELGYRTVLWSIDTVDWQRPAPEVIRNRVLNKMENGAIVLMHPTAPTVNALPGIIDALHEQGYQLITVGKMLEQMPKQ
ncbi:Peptidoglycan-N-acetylglucosamine deacetylase [Sporotomaculum syntrophicum]|uniref:Peptidoglycan-N-acetylglucosamine deacetylase n=1 Tax=Sporotomaculum syntrophicum TaxID=182264 RepID=A0A9D2WNR9_9FIRM|nr:polysaccharide deacetylase family protein [Sporotomaculum syntrophicum]KAF1084578.1 Peptidoglycan-N-acetylglucosamine deacetylase [Sporotomaculum syntrophicum]